MLCTTAINTSNTIRTQTGAAEHLSEFCLLSHKQRRVAAHRDSSFLALKISKKFQWGHWKRGHEMRVG